MGVCDVPVISSVCDSAGEAAAGLVTAPFDWLAESMGNAAAWMFKAVWKVFDSTTFVDVTGSEFTKLYSILFGVAVFVMLGFFLLQVIGGMVRREPAALNRAVLGLAKSILGSFVVLTLLAAALEVTDQLCIGIVHATGTNMKEMGDRIALLATGLTGLTIAAPGAGAIVTIFLGGLALGGAILVWISLLVRKALLLLAIVFAPIALAGSSWDHTRGWVSKWASFVIAMILSKVVIVVMFLLATAQISAPIDADLKSASEPIAGIVLMLMAGFAPYLSYKAISFMGFDMYHAMSAEQESKNALNRPMPMPSTRRGGSSPRSVLDSQDNSNGGGPRGGSSGVGGTSPSPDGGSAVGSGRGRGNGGSAVANNAGKGNSASAGGSAGGSGAGGAGAGVGGGAAGGVMAGVGAAVAAARAGHATGKSVGGHVEQQSDAVVEANQTQHSPPMPHVSDPTPKSTGKRGA